MIILTMKTKASVEQVAANVRVLQNDGFDVQIMQEADTIFLAALAESGKQISSTAAKDLKGVSFSDNNKIFLEKSGSFIEAWEWLRFRKMQSHTFVRRGALV